MQLQPGQLILAPFLPAIVEVKQFELRAGYALLEVVLRDGYQTYKALRITPEQLNQILHWTRNLKDVKDRTYFDLLKEIRMEDWRWRILYYVLPLVREDIPPKDKAIAYFKSALARCIEVEGPIQSVMKERSRLEEH